MSFFTGSGRYKPLQSLKSVLPDVESDEETVFLRGAFTSHRSSTLYSDLTPDPSDIHGNTESGWNFNDEKLHMNAQINELHINTGNDDKSDMESSEYQTIGFGFEASNWGDRTSSDASFWWYVSQFFAGKKMFSLTSHNQGSIESLFEKNS